MFYLQPVPPVPPPIFYHELKIPRAQCKYIAKIVRISLTLHVSSLLVCSLDIISKRAGSYTSMLRSGTSGLPREKGVAG